MVSCFKLTPHSVRHGQKGIALALIHDYGMSPQALNKEGLTPLQVAGAAGIHLDPIMGLYHRKVPELSLCRSFLQGHGGRAASTGGRGRADAPAVALY